MPLDAVLGWQDSDCAIKKDMLIAQTPVMMGKLFCPYLAQKSYQQILEMEGPEFLQTMNTENFQVFLNQFGHTPPKYRFR